jgi:hypothetical protein
VRKRLYPEWRAISTATLGPQRVLCWMTFALRRIAEGTAAVFRNVFHGLRRMLPPVSLIVFLAIMAIWARSYWVADEVLDECLYVAGDCANDATRRLFISSRGSLQVMIHPAPPRFPEEVKVFRNGWLLHHWTPSSTSNGISAGMQSLVKFRLAIEDSVVIVRCPHWAVAMLTLVLPVRQIRRWATRRPGMCTTCGYDLRASPNCCPECGEILKQDQKSVSD